MIRNILGAALLASLAVGSVSAQMAKTVMVGGGAMDPSKNIVENAMNSKDHTTLVAAVKAGDLAATLQGAGPFTVFAPTNAAFAKLPVGTVDTLLTPTNKTMLQKVLTYHVVAGKMDSASLKAKAKDGKVELTTVAGGKLWVMVSNWTIQDEKGMKAKITVPDVHQSNGVIHVIDAVVMAK